MMYKARDGSIIQSQLIYSVASKPAWLFVELSEFRQSERTVLLWNPTGAWYRRGTRTSHLQAVVKALPMVDD